ncbi:arabinose ABC transporter permease [Kosmotoga arenicorallina S304]|uniref:Arabinose ABC transporter permease n=1 Tax=Kosmotoga arenicorallina S304 TaxID=1453497 RepID=A0A176K159_9BACT|nr:MFS transporter [Kosmotoga arenicorallina]OAA30616.1 arabinose ABC transporter permease [Kosmotoga arenicorallina S304]
MKAAHLLVLYTAVTGVGGSMFRVVFNLFLREQGFSNDFIGSVTSASLWGSALLGLAIGILADRTGKKKIIALASFLVPVTGILMILQIPKTALLTLSFFRGGFFSIGFTVITAALTMTTDHGNRAKIFGANFGISMGAGVFGNFLGGLFGDLIGLKGTIVISMVLYLLSIVPVSFIKFIDFKSSIKEIFNFNGLDKSQWKILLLYFGANATVGFGAGLFIHFGNLIFKDLFGLSATMIGISLSIAQIGTAAGAIFSHKLGKKFGPLKFAFLMQLLVVPLIFSLAYVREPFAFTGLYAFRFVFMNITVPIMNSVVFSRLPREKLSTISGVNGLLNNSLRAIAAMFFGQIVGASIIGYSRLFLISTFFYALNALIAFAIYRLYERGKQTRQLFN